jgi:hypothetical protein
MSAATTDEIRQVFRGHARLPIDAIKDQDDLFQASL